EPSSTPTPCRPGSSCAAPPAHRRRRAEPPVLSGSCGSGPLAGSAGEPAENGLLRTVARPRPPRDEADVPAPGGRPKLDGGRSALLDLVEHAPGQERIVLCRQAQRRSRDPSDELE